MKRRLFAWLLLLSPIGVCHAAELMEGDLIFHESKSAQSKAVQAATGSKYSPMGMIVHRSGKPHVPEAAGTVTFTPLAQWIARSEGGRYTVKRLKERTKVLTPEALVKASAIIKQLAGRSYDLTFEWSDDRIYCSELVWKIYDQAAGVQIGALQKLKEFKLDAPDVQPMLKQRYGEKVPLDEPVTSPVAMIESPLLEVVVARRLHRGCPSSKLPMPPGFIKTSRLIERGRNKWSHQDHVGSGAQIHARIGDLSAS